MHLTRLAVVVALGGAATRTRAAQWPYTRTYENATTPVDEHNDEIPDLFLGWLKDSVKYNSDLSASFKHGEIPDHVASLEHLEHHAACNYLNRSDLPKTVWDTIPPDVELDASQEAAFLFSNLDFELEPECIKKKENYWYRKPDGSCNWLKRGESYIGSTGQPRSRDFKQTAYADGISAPREGPNPREVSNAFFKRKQRLHYEHTPLMLGLVEFLMHDVTYSADSDTEYIDVPIPRGDPAYDPYEYGNKTFRVWRSQPFAGTGTSKQNPRQHVNGATAWLDCSALYGSTPDVVDAVRSHRDGKLKAQRGPDGFEYLPFNADGLPVRTRPGVDPRDLFLGGDVRTNEDWIMLSVHTLLLREHNRLCDLVLAQYPDWDDERIYQTVKLLLSSKLALIGNSYQMAYWTEDMPWPRDDGFPLFRAEYDESFVSVNPIHSYPWPLVTPDNRPTVTSAEMSIVYRFHEFIINKFPIKDARNQTIEEREIFSTAFDAKGFISLGADSILRGMLASDIPNFKSGVDETFRSAGRYRGSPFDIVTWSIVHEREQGLPTFNQYFSAHANQKIKPGVDVKLRKRFEDFSSDPQAVADLKRLYKTPDDVDFVVGVQLEEEMFPGTTMPRSALIPSLLSLFGVGNSDRFSPGFAVTRCFLVDKPWDCHPSNALEDILWEPRPTEDFPNKRWLSTFWAKELDLQAHGTNLLWRLITENSGAKCIQRNPLFPFDPVKNPVLCELPEEKSYTNYYIAGATTLVALLATAGYWLHEQRAAKRVMKANGLRAPPTNNGVWLLGVGAKLRAEPYRFVVEQARNFHGMTFGLRLVGSLIYYVCATPEDVRCLINDESRASLHALAADAQLGAVVGRSNLRNHLHATVARRRLDTALHASNAVPTLRLLAGVVERTVQDWLKDNEKRLKAVPDFRDLSVDLVARIMVRVCIGTKDDMYKNATLLTAFKELSRKSTIVFGIANFFPGWIARRLADHEVRQDYKTISKYILPFVKERRKKYTPNKPAEDTLLDSFLDAATDDDEVVKLVGGIVVSGLMNLADALTNALYDVAEKEGLQDTVRAREDVSRIVPDKPSSSSWNLLRSVTLETLRMAGAVIGPVRKIITKDFKLGSNAYIVVPNGSGLAASPVLMHYRKAFYDNPRQFHGDRFTNNDAQIGSEKFLSFGLPSHTCPGRFFAIQTVSIALNAIVSRWNIQLVGNIPSENPDDRYNYSIGRVVMPRKPVKLIFTHRC